MRRHTNVLLADKCFMHLTKKENDSNPTDDQLLRSLLKVYPPVCVILLIPLQKLCDFLQFPDCACKHKKSQKGRKNVRKTPANNFLVKKLKCPGIKHNPTRKVLQLNNQSVSFRNPLEKMHIGILNFFLVMHIAQNTCSD